MHKLASPHLDGPPSWRYLVEAAIFEANPGDLPRRIQDAQDAIMDYIENSFEASSQSERQSMINAMNSLRELRRLFLTGGPEATPGSFTDA